MRDWLRVQNRDRFYSLVGEFEHFLLALRRGGAYCRDEFYLIPCDWSGFLLTNEHGRRAVLAGTWCRVGLAPRGMRTPWAEFRTGQLR